MAAAVRFTCHTNHSLPCTRFRAAPLSRCPKTSTLETTLRPVPKQAVDLLSGFEKTLGVDLPGSLLFEYPTVEEIEEYLVTNNLLGKCSLASTIPYTQP